MTQAPKYNSLWIPPDAVPPPLNAPRFVLEPLAEQHAELDFEALMSCRARLRQELQWAQWPPEDFTLELNRADLRRHHGEFLRGEAFAYTVLSPDRVRCLGCIYLERCPEIDGAQLAFWVIDDAIEVEAELVAAVLQWVHAAWSIDRVLLPLREANTRGIALAQKCGFVATDVAPESPLSNHRCFLSERGGEENRTEISSEIATKAPPTIPNQPTASEDDPVIAGVTIVSSRDCGSSNRWEFTINRGEEDIAIDALLDALDDVTEFSLADHSRGDTESCATYRREGENFKTKAGGHGWSGEWKTIEREWAVYEAQKQVKYNYGPGWNHCGHLIRHK